MDLISTPLAVVLMVVGTAALLGAAVVARREPLPARGTPGRLSLLTPWIGSALVVVLLVRGALAGAAVVAAATLIHAGVQRGRASRGGSGR